MARRNLSALLAITFVVFIMLPGTSFAQWAKTFSTGADDLTGIMMPSPSSAGNFSLLGQIGTETAGKALIARHNSSGAVVWAKTITTNSSKELLIAREFNDGSFLVSGTKDLSATSTPAKNIVWAKFNSSWAPVYQKMFGGARDEDAVFADFTSDGGFIGIGDTNSYGASASDYDIFAGKVNASGNFQWIKVIHYGADDRGVDMAEITGGGGYIALAGVQSATGADILVFKLDAAGNIVWKKLFSKSGYNYGDGLYLLKNGDILVMGTTQSATGLENLVLIRLNASGGVVWQKTYGNSQDTMDALNVFENSDGTFIVSGSASHFSMTPPFALIQKILIMKLFSTGVIQSQKTLTDGKMDTATLVAGADGQLLLEGSSMAISATAMDTDVLYGKIDPSTLNPLWVKAFGGAGNEIGGIINTGSTYFLSGMTDSFPVGGPMKTFGLTLDGTGSYSGCPPIKNVTLTSGTASIAVSNGTFVASTPVLTLRTAGQPVNTTLTVSAKTLTEAAICSSTATKPAPPTNLTAVSASTSAVKLTWAASAGATSYKVYRKAGTVTTWTLINTATTTSYQDPLAAGNTTTASFSYYVQACNTAGCSAATKVATVPFAPTAMTATPGTGNVVLKWTDKSANETGFQVFRKPGACSAAGTWTVIANLGPNVKTYTNAGLTAGSTFSYRVRAYFRSATPYSYGYSANTACANATVK